MQQNQNEMIQGNGQQMKQVGNTLLPLPIEMEANEYYKYTQMEVRADLGVDSGDIYKVGSKKVGNSWVDTFSLAKPMLMKLSVAAGVQFDPKNTGGEYMGKNCYKGKAYGAILQADGTSKTHYDEKVINLEDEEDNFKLEFLNKSIEGITNQKQAKEAEKTFRGEWRNTVDKWGKNCNAYFIHPEDRTVYIERGVLVNMILLRKTMAEKAMTGAQLRVIRSLLGIKSGYSRHELERPFVIPRVAFSPNLADPTVKMAVIDRGLNAATAMFGTREPVAMVEPKTATKPHEENLEEVGEMFETEAFQSEHLATIGGAEGAVTMEQGELPQGNSEAVCSFCGKAMSENDYLFSLQEFGKSVCYECHMEGKV